MNGIKISTEELSDFRSRFSHLADEWTSVSDDFIKAANEFAETWEGDSKQEFLDIVNDEMRARLSRLRDRMEEYCGFLDEAVKMYSGNEENVRNIIGRLRM